MSDDPVLAAIARLEIALAASRRDARADLTELRVAMMGRIDRLQDVMTRNPRRYRCGDGVLRTPCSAPTITLASWSACRAGN